VFVIIAAGYCGGHTALLTNGVLVIFILQKNPLFYCSQVTYQNGPNNSMLMSFNIFYIQRLLNPLGNVFFKRFIYKVFAVIQSIIIKKLMNSVLSYGTNEPVKFGIYRIS
jgi:hypothetical protein